MTIKYFLLFIILLKFLCANDTVVFTSDEQVYLKSKKEIKVCVDPNALPLAGKEEGKYIGITVDIISLLKKQISIPIRVISVKSWEECIKFSKEKKVDIVALILTSPNKHKHLIPTHKVIDGAIGIATKMEKNLIYDLSEIRDEKVAIHSGQSSINQYIKHLFPHLKTVMVPTIEDGLNMVAKGEVYGYIDETYALAYNILNLHSNELKIMERINKKPLHGSLGIHKDNLNLLSIMNKLIENTNEKEIRNIIHDWISVRVEKGFDYVLLIQVLSVFLLLVFMSLYWVDRLSKEVLKRKKAEKKLAKFNLNLKEEIASKIKEIHYKDTMLLEKTKLAAMGEMIGSIAHQWRRPLSTLHINVEMLEEDYREDKIDKIFLENFIKKNSEIIQYMSHTIDDFQNFYKVDKEKQYFDVMEKISFVSNLKLNQLEDNHITISKKGESFVVFGYSSEFQQVILNIIGNAKDALVERKVEEPFIKINVWSDNDRGYIQILDNAEGIDDEILDRIFEPYVTTKKLSGSMGFGLYISKMIIEKNMQGLLTIINTDVGSEVLISFAKEKDV